MNDASGAQVDASAVPLDTGLSALALIAGYYRIAADPAQMKHDLAIGGRAADADDIVRAANRLGLKARIVRGVSAARLAAMPLPAIVGLREGGFGVVSMGVEKTKLRFVDIVKRAAREVAAEDILPLTDGRAILVARRIGGAGTNPKMFGFSWFLPSLYRYRKPLTQVVLASLFVQLFALATPIFFQLIVDKVLIHKGLSTLIVLVTGLVAVGVFETVLQYLRTYTLTHTTNRIDVELGRRLFHHLFRLPLAYFETRAAGQTVARVSK